MAKENITKGKIWTFVVIVFLLGAFVGYSYEKAKFVKLTEVQRLDMQQQIDNLKTKTSRYVEYSEGVLDSLTDKRRVLYFYASWCPTCRPADADFKANADKLPEDLVLIRVNYNDPDTDSQEKDLAKKYAITYQHTFVQIDREGNEVTKWNGGETEELLSNLK